MVSAVSVVVGWLRGRSAAGTVLLQVGREPVGDGVHPHLPVVHKMARSKAPAALVLGQNPHKALDLHETKPTCHFGLPAILSGDISISGADS